MKVIHISIPVEPTACPRPRVSKFGTYYPKTYTEYQKKASSWLHNNISDDVFDATEAPLEITYTFVHSRPKYMSTKKYSADRLLHTKRPDVDNLIKSVNDTLQSTGIIKDDSQIYSCTGIKYYAAVAETPAIHITIKKGLDVSV